MCTVSKFSLTSPLVKENLLVQMRLYSETDRTNLFLICFAHIVRHERDGIFFNDVFADVAVVNLKGRILRHCACSNRNKCHHL